MTTAGGCFLKALFHKCHCVLLVAVCICLAGCSDASQVVKIRLTYEGKDYVPVKGEYLLVILVPMDGQGSTSFPANPQPDGSFAVESEGKGLPPGKYHVKIVNPMQNGRAVIPEPYTRVDSPLIREVVLGKPELDPVELTLESPSP